MSQRKACDVCNFARDSVHRYGLSRQSVRTAEHPNTTWGMGSIDLCEECWTRIAKPRLRPQRRSRRTVVVHTAYGTHTKLVPSD